MLLQPRGIDGICVSQFLWQICLHSGFYWSKHVKRNSVVRWQMGKRGTLLGIKLKEYSLVHTVETIVVDMA